MIAYNKTWLQNLIIREQATEAYAENCIDKEELQRINEQHPSLFYSPNIFVRTGLFLLTFIILLFSFGLIALLFSDALDNALGGLAIFFGLLAYAALEWMVQTKNHYRSGVDDALLWIAAGCFFGGVCYLADVGETGNCLLVFFISLYCVVRFTDRVMSLMAFIALVGFFFFISSKSGNTLKAIVPFILIAISAGVYLFCVKAKQVAKAVLYAECLQIMMITALIIFYGAGNYFVVRELSNEMFHLNLADNEQIPFGWLFWIFTFTIPLIFIARGIQEKDTILIRVGLLLIAAIIVTVRYYYNFAPVEIIMVISGILLLIISYGLIKYLKKPKYGFTRNESISTDLKEMETIESLILAETFSQVPATSNATKFGGGDFGGAGSSGEF